MNAKSIALIVGIAVVILVVIISPSNQEGSDSAVILPVVIDEPALVEDITIDTEVEEESSEEIVLITNEDGPDYWIDENGLKHYVLDAADSPDFGE